MLSVLLARALFRLSAHTPAPEAFVQLPPRKGSDGQFPTLRVAAFSFSGYWRPSQLFVFCPPYPGGREIGSFNPML